jgi:uncharacterized phiE125 gp8 family phage protein
VQALITSARLMVEAQTRRLLITQTWRLSLDAWPASRIIDLPLTPFRELAGIRVSDADGDMQPLAATLYILEATPQRPRLRLSAPLPVPGRALSGIEIDVVVGYGDAPGDVPSPLRLAIQQLVARWFENRGDAESDATRLPADVMALIAPFRAVRLA